MLTIEIITTDLWRDDCGWSANGCYVDRVTLEVPETLSDRALSRRIREAAGINGRADFRADGWSGAEWSWRSGSTGVYAEVIA